MQDQFLCRAKFVQAQVECNNAKPLQGADGDTKGACVGLCVRCPEVAAMN